ncbi:MAG: hypothetical protein V4612_07575 [Pseudomonadota bacterium]
MKKSLVISLILIITSLSNCSPNVNNSLRANQSTKSSNVDIFIGGREIKYYDNSNDSDVAFFNKEKEAFINLNSLDKLTKEQRNQILMNRVLRGREYLEYKDSNLSKEQKEALVTKNVDEALKLINFYHNQGGQANNWGSKIMKWVYSNSSMGEQYDASQNYVNNFYDIATSKITPQILDKNNKIAGGIKKKDREEFANK